MALAKLVIGPASALVSVDDTGIARVAAFDATGAATTIPALTRFTSDAGIAAIGTVSGTALPIDPVAPGNCEIWVSDGGVILSNKIKVAVFDPETGPSRRHRPRR